MDLEILILGMLPMECGRFAEFSKGHERPEELTKKLKQLIDEGLVEIKSDGQPFYDLTEKGLGVVRKYNEEMRRQVAASREFEIHPAGGVIKELNFVYEPLSEKEFVYNWDGEKGIAQIKEAKGGTYYLEIRGKRFWFSGAPLTEKDLIFRLPDRFFVEQWVSNKIKSKTTQEIWKCVKNYIETMIDESEEYYQISALSVFQSWFKHFLPCLWYIGIFGEWGGGKTSLLEVLTSVCHHGYIIANPSIAFIGRCLDRMKITAGIDELDTIQNEELLSIIRQGYRRSFAKYSRIGENMSPQTFDVFAPWVISVHGSLDDALQSRTFPIMLAETQDPRLPIVNLVKHDLGQKVYNELFIWYLDNIFGIFHRNPKGVDLVDQIDLVDRVGGVDHTPSRESIFLSLTSLLDRGQISQLGQLKGRSLELGYLVALVSSLLGVEINIVRLSELARETIEEMREIGVIGLLRDWLVGLYKERRAERELRNSRGEFMVSNKDVFNGFNDYLLSTRRAQVDARQFRALAMDLGFSGESRKKAKIKLLEEIGSDAEPRARLCLIFSERVARRLGLDYVKMVEEGKKMTEQEILKDLDKP